METSVFFTGGALAPEYSLYISRKADATALHAVNHGKYIYAIAPRQMGKTSLLKRIRVHLQQHRWTCCFLDLAAMRTTDGQKWFRELGEAIGQACDLDENCRWPEDQNQFKKFLLKNAGLASKTDSRSLVLFLDEVEGLLGLPFADEFLMTLRDLYQQRESYPGKLIVGFAGAIDPVTLVRSRNSPFNISEEIVLHDFTEEESRQLTLHLSGLGVPVEEAVHAHIYGWAAGHPHLTQSICERIERWVNSGDITKLTPEIVDAVVRTDLLAPEAPDKNVKHVLREISKLISPASELWRRVVSGETVYSTQPGFYVLYLTGAVKTDAQERIVIRNRIYETALADARNSPQIIVDVPVDPAGTPITWLHLSDIHFREAQSYDENIVLRRLLSDVQKLIQAEGLAPDFIVVSGDVAFASQPKEYELAMQFLDELRQITGLGKQKLILVPGNHDVDRKSLGTLGAGAWKHMTDRDAVTGLLSNSEDRAVVMRRFHFYQDFCNQYFEETVFDAANYFSVKKIQVGRQAVALLALNSAWLCGSDEDRNRLVLGEYQVNAALKNVGKGELCIAVMHHPLDWLQDYDRSDVGPLLWQNCRFVLQGHMHEVGLLQAQTPDSRTMVISAGTCYETRKYPNSYNLVRFDPASSKGKIFLRMYSDKQGGFWTKDVVNYKNVTAGTYEFALPIS